MGRQNLAYLAFNRGLVSPLALARADIKRMALSAEVHTNYAPNELGSMTLRPGLGYIVTTKSNNEARCIPFVFSTSDVARVEFTNLIMRVLVADVPVTRVAVSSVVVNGDFNANLANWTDNDEAGGLSVWVAGGYMGLNGNGTAAAIRDQTVTVAVADRGVEHALRILIANGPVTLRVGTGTTDDSYVRETSLDTGEHSLAFTPTNDFNIRFLARLKRQVQVNSCNVEAAGVMAITSPYATADLDYIVGGPDSQSGDIIFVACEGYQQTKVERRAARSWSLVYYYAEDGPLRNPNVGPITITPSVIFGNGSLTASAPLFRTTHVGAIYRLTSAGQTVTATITAQNTFTLAIEVNGVGAQRVFTEQISGLSGTGSTVTLQRSLVSSTGPWTDYVGGIVADQTVSVDDALDNQTIWYRIGVKTGGYAAGTIQTDLIYQNGSVDGFVRVVSYTSNLLVGMEVLTDLGGVAATDDWAEGQWSDLRGWPSAGAFYEGRLWWGGLNGVNGSVSDAFYSYLDTTEGDSGPISRSIGSGPVDRINWMLPLQRMILGAEGGEFSARASSFDEILTPTNFNMKPASSQGSGPVQGVKIDSRGIYVQRGGTRVYELSFDGETYDYGSTQLSALCPEIGQPSIIRMAVQRQPNTRVHFVRSDGTAAIVVYNKSENLICWWDVETDGNIEDVSVLPGAEGTEEDQVYYVVARTVNGVTVRNHEKWAKESECIGGTTNKQADAFITGTNAPASATIALPHLPGATVVVWYDGKCESDADGDPKTYTADGAGNVTIGETCTTWVAGLAYTAQWQSAKLNQLQAQLGTPLVQHKKLNGLGLVLANTHHRGIKVGQDFTNMRGMPTTEGGKPVPADTVWAHYDAPTFAVNGSWDTDARLCLQSQAPRPATVVAAVVDVTLNE